MLPNFDFHIIFPIDENRMASKYAGLWISTDNPDLEVGDVNTAIVEHLREGRFPEFSAGIVRLQVNPPKDEQVP